LAICVWLFDKIVLKFESGGWLSELCGWLFAFGGWLLAICGWLFADGYLKVAGAF